MSHFAPRPVPEPVAPGEESAWEYPRPPRLERATALLEIVLGGTTIAATRDGWRVLETSHPPNYYLPRDAFAPSSVEPAGGASFCEFKGRASYWTLRGGGVTVPDAAWSYEEPSAAFAPIAGHLAVYADRVDACFVDGERVTPQPGGFYGGWITAAVKGPFKGVQGSRGW
jgi:uncharacterized protein (DUF427 family)